MELRDATEDDKENDEDAIRCWICLEDLLLPMDLTGAATTVDNVEIPPDCVAPCRCKGSSRLVHESCLMEWYFLVCLSATGHAL